jgi:hypothetical protein
MRFLSLRKIGFGWCWVISAFVNLLFVLPILGLMVWGKKARKTIPPANFDKDLWN